MRWPNLLIFALALCGTPAFADPPTSAPATAPATAPASPRAKLNKAAILKLIETQRRIIDTLSVDFRFDSTLAESSSPKARYAAKVIIRGHDAARQISIDRSYSATDGNSFHQPITFNGKYTCWNQEFNQVAGLMPGLLENADIRHEAFFQLNMLADPGKSPDIKQSASLVGLLQNPYTTVRPRLDQINGVWCYVLDNGGWFHTDLTVWLDANRGFLPIRQKYFGEKNEGTTEWDTDHSEPIAGHWFATEGREILPTGETFKLTITQDEHHNPQITINEKLPDGFFDLWKHLPEGTHIFNQAANRTYVVGENGQLTIFAEGKDAAGEEVSPELHGKTAGSPLSPKLIALIAAPAGFLVISLLAILVGSWIVLRKQRSALTSS